jgi:hypothetical protein
MQALLELNCMPAGMELFPAANEEQWSWIKKVIDESDYYVVVLAGRYGSIARTSGQSYTEMEYRYALETKKPIIGFLHTDPTQLPAKLCEQSDEARTKLASFRELVGSRLCKMWDSPSDLGAKVSRSITQLMKSHPSVGWVRSDAVPSDELLALRRKVEALQAELEKVAAQGPVGIEDLSQGRDRFAIGFAAERSVPKEGKSGVRYWVKAVRVHGQVNLTWDYIFASIAPSLIEATDPATIVGQLNNLVAAEGRPALMKKYPDDRLQDIRIHRDSYDTLIVQLRALGLIATHGDVNQWGLTPFGDQYMNKLIAVRRTPSANGKRRNQQRKS